MYYFDVETRMECVHQMFHHSIWLQALLQLKKQRDIHSKLPLLGCPSNMMMMTDCWMKWSLAKAAI